MHNKRMAMLIVVAVLALCAHTRAGQLSPPPGPIQPTDRVQLNAQSVTLPYTIIQPGSYVLTSNLTGVAGQSGIIIDADDVTLDLNGFSVLGVPGSSNGIQLQGLVFNCSILNGTVRGWGGHGITGENGGRSAILKDIRAYGNGGFGIIIGEGTLIIRCTAESNGDTGILGFGGCVIRECTAQSNGNRGIKGDGGTLIESCTALTNGVGTSGKGIYAVSGCAVIGCTAFNNNGIGIDAEDSTVTQCTAHVNDSYGIRSEDSLVRGCTSILNSAASYNDIGGTVYVENR